MDNLLHSVQSGMARFLAKLALARLMDMALDQDRPVKWDADIVWEEELRRLVPDQEPWDIVTEKYCDCAAGTVCLPFLDQRPALAATGYQDQNGRRWTMSAIWPRASS